jgi:hypothetical protein
MLTQAELAAIEARLRAATPGPWYASNALNEYAPFCDIVAQDANESWVCEKYSILDGIKTEDCEFIAHARADIPALLAHVRELQTQLDAERWRDVNDPDAEMPPLLEDATWSDAVLVIGSGHLSTAEPVIMISYYHLGGEWTDFEAREMRVAFWRPLPNLPKEAQE